MTTRTLADKLQAAAEGDPTATASTTILSRAADGRLLDVVALAWDGDALAEIDWPTTRHTSGYLSGGERPLLALADSLATGNPVDLGDTLTGLDEDNARIVLMAISQALGIRVLGGGVR